MKYVIRYLWWTLFSVTNLYLSSVTLLTAEDYSNVFQHPMTIQNNPEVKTIFDNISKKKILIANFTQVKMIARLDRNLTFTGTLLFVAEKGIAWLVKNPFPSTTIITAEAMIQKGANGKKLSSQKGNGKIFSEFSRTVQGIFLGRFSEIIADYNIYYTSMPNQRWEIGLKPKNSILQQAVKAFEIHGHSFINLFKIYENTGDKILYMLDNMSFPKEIPVEYQSVFS